MTQNATPRAVPVEWVALLNEQADEWYQLSDVGLWLSAILGRPAAPSDEAVQNFWNTLILIRTVIYDLHFGRTPDWNPINERLEGVSFAFSATAPGKLPKFRARHVHPGKNTGEDIQNDSAILDSLASTVLADFAQDLSRKIAQGSDLDIVRCEGLYRDPKINRLSAAPNVPEEEELQWRREVEVLVEKGLERSLDVLRCADIFISANRSRFCSNACRTNTFQIVKQLMDPEYLAEKQRRYREKKK